MAKRLTLAEQLSQIAQPAPDFDPEDSYATYGQEKNTERSRDLTAARSEYVEVGTSKLRKRGEAIYDSKYEGKKGSRKALYGDEDEDDQSDDDEEGMDDFEDLEGDLQGGEGDDDSEEDDDLSGDDEGLSEDDEDEDEEEEVVETPVIKKSSSSSKKEKKSSSSNRTTTTEQDEKAMLKQLTQAASADVEKGRDVKKQLAFCDNLLEARIKIQKGVVAVNTLPQKDKASSYFSLLPEELAETLAEVEAMNEELFALRRDLLLKNEQIELPTNFGAARKRKRGEDKTDEYLSATLLDLASLESILEPYLRTTITKWSDKVTAASGLALGQSKKFKAVNSNAMVQIDHALSSTERERLIKRTRVRRNGDEAIGRVKEIVLEGEKAGVDSEVFDDGDFYMQLLRDVVESRMLDLDDPTLAHLRLVSARGKRQKKVVDTRASKGRKIRYHVHEKLQSFMVPIEAATWHEEQTDELFASLLGRTFNAVKTGEKEAEVGVQPGAMFETGSTVDVGSLRIFG